MADVIPGNAVLPCLLTFADWAETCAGTPVDYHMHTNYTDGHDRVADMIAAASGCGMAKILLSEHIRHTSTYYPDFVAEVNANRNTDLKVYNGVEAKILNLSGDLDCSRATAADCDAVIGSVHSLPIDTAGNRTKWSELKAEEALTREFDLAMAIVTRSAAHILGHPMGMVIRRFGINPLPELTQLATACRAHGKAFELNARYCVDRDDWIDLVRKSGCPVSIGSDAHEAESVGKSWRLFVHNDIETT